MKDYGISTYGDRVADVYDERAEVVQQDTESAVAFLAELASEGPVLELAIGTGRLALPLAERGIEVQGVDASERMVERLRAKPGGEAIPVAMGDFADVPVDGEFHLVFVAFNTLFALLSQEAQLRCFRNVAEHLAAGGAFAIEVFVPDLCRFDRGQRVDAMLVDTDAVDVNVARHYPSEQRIESQHVRASESGIRLYPVQIRYAWPAELDLMARLAGMRLRDRFGGWRRERFGDASERHVSLYELGA